MTAASARFEAVVSGSLLWWSSLVLYFHHPASLEHDPRVLFAEHPDSPERIEVIESALESAGWPQCVRRLAPEGTIAELELVHAPMHVGFVRRLCLSGGGQLDADTFVGERCYRAALHAAGGACAMVRELVAGAAESAFCAMRPAGHHETVHIAAVASIRRSTPIDPRGYGLRGRRL